MQKYVFSTSFSDCEARESRKQDERRGKLSVQGLISLLAACGSGQGSFRLLSSLAHNVSVLKNLPTVAFNVTNNLDLERKVFKGSSAALPITPVTTGKKDDVETDRWTTNTVTA